MSERITPKRMSQRDVELAREISAAARDQGLTTTGRD